MNDKKDGEILKALSIQQPWAYAILHLGKDVENRTWETGVRGRIQVHAGKKIDRAGLTWLAEQGHDVPDDLPTGCILGEVSITDCVPAEDIGVTASEWVFGPYCFLLDLPEAYAEPIPGAGRLGFFETDHAGSCIE